MVPPLIGGISAPHCRPTTAEPDTENRTPRISESARGTGTTEVPLTRGTTDQLGWCCCLQAVLPVPRALGATAPVPDPVMDESPPTTLTFLDGRARTKMKGLDDSVVVAPEWCCTNRAGHTEKVFVLHKHINNFLL
ncbi:hypothetical protein TRIUR3_12032 [Triticum urartu]|uniref:Uncharacterized protein n=1 Tax=Triticum urartu TaxID=4572 RepID=M7ZAY4_TRIUA|nr:hypothetical protein TRIUR3_12032 [Triticum urartu]